MIRNKLIILALIILAFLPGIIAASHQSGEHLLINEFMAANSLFMPDEDGDFEDWIEIFNAGDVAVNLSGYGLSDNALNPFRWMFPDIEILPGEFLLVWASGKNRTDPMQPLHTSFSISSSGEELLITSPEGQTLDYLPPVALPSNISRGRQPDGGNQWFYFSEPTPGQSNDTPAFEHIWQPPVFSHFSGFYTDPFQLAIITSEPGATILYTLDGSEPDEENLGGTTYLYKKSYAQYPGNPPGELFTGAFQTMAYETPISVYNKSGDPDSITRRSSSYHFNPYYFPADPVFKGTVVRARVAGEGGIQGPVITHVYFVHPQGRERYPLTVLNLSTSPAALFDYYSGIYNPGIDFDLWRQANPNEDATGGRPANYHRRGTAWEYPGHFVLFEPGQQGPSLLTNMGFRIHGGWSRSFPQKSLRLYARDSYGSSYFQHSIFPELQYSRYKRLILRNSGNDWYYTKFRDAALQRIIAPLHFDTQASRPTILFINGEFWGLLNIRERYDKHYLERVYGVDPDNIDYLEGNAMVKEGDAVHYQETLSYIEENNLDEPEHFEYVQTRIDTENYIDYQVANIFISNTDWPGNNMDYWRLRTDSFITDAPYGRDGRWRWMAYDVDFGFGMYGGLPDHNTLAFAADPSSDYWANPPWSTFLFRNLLLNEDFGTRFIVRFSDLLNTLFLPGYVNQVIDDMVDEIEPVMPENILRWERPQNMIEWYMHINTMISFAQQRHGYQWQHLQEFFNLSDPLTVSLDVSDHDHGHIQFNTVAIHPETPGVSATPFPWQGSWFPQVPVTVTAIPARGYAFSHWSGNISSDEPELNFTPTQNFSLTAHFTEVYTTDLIHFWYFNTAIPNDSPLQSLPSWFSATTEPAVLEFQSCLEGYPYSSGHPLWRKASMERRNKPTPVNYLPEGNNNQPYDAGNMRGIQVKQPFRNENRENAMILRLPSTDFEKVVFSFAVVDEGAADALIIDYSVAEDSDLWTTEGLIGDTIPLSSDYAHAFIDFSGIPSVDNNPWFSVRIRFMGEDMEADAGNRVTFNNISLEGRSLLPSQVEQNTSNHNIHIYPNPVSGDNLFLPELMDIHLYELHGRKIMRLQKTNVVPVSNLSPGIYIIRNQLGQWARVVVMR